MGRPRAAQRRRSSAVLGFAAAAAAAAGAGYAAVARSTTRRWAFAASSSRGLRGRGGGCCAAAKGREFASAEDTRRSDEESLVRVVTYNVLAPPLCSETRFPRCSPKDLSEEVRWRRILAKLDSAVAQDRPTVVCLQEVGEAWAGRLHASFQQRGWHFAYAPTPMTYYLPMGVALAWPNDQLELEHLAIQRIGAAVNCPRPQPPPTWREKLLARLSFGKFGRLPSAEDALLEPWSTAARKQNRLLAARLRLRSSGQSFAVATYHMPCLFGEPAARQAKAIHAAILHSSATGFAAAAGRRAAMPLVLAGDMNTKPGDSELDLVKGAQELVTGDQACPPAVPSHGLSLGALRRASQPPRPRLRSAYEEALGEEPGCTNYAWVEDEPEPFRETIDYVFVSEGVEVDGVQELPHVEVGDPPYPTAEEPSDHMLLAADLRLSAPPPPGTGPADLRLSAPPPPGTGPAA